MPRDTVTTTEEHDPWIVPIAENAALDPAAEKIGGRARRLDESPLGPVLRGEWLGHALHPLMTDLPIGCWTSAAIIDVVGGRDGRVAARRLVGLGTLLALPTAATGLVELASIDEEDVESRRIAVVHAGANSIALVAFARSWQARRKGRQARGVLWSLFGATVASGAGHLGGHLAFVRGIGDGGRRATHEGPDHRATDTGSSALAGEDAVIGWDSAAEIVQVPPDNLRAMVDQGLVVPQQEEPPTFRRSDLEAVRLLGG
ncbi:MAG: DUF2231 domain-containing protein [Microthrixaceae bacterium]